MRRTLWLVLLLLLALPLLDLGSAPVLAGPVEWHEVQSTEAGRQWWDSGSLRLRDEGMLTVLSRFQPAQSDGSGRDAANDETRPRSLGTLYVMEIDCGQDLFRDTSVNGLPRWGAPWQPVGPDTLIAAVVSESCQAAGLRPT